MSREDVEINAKDQLTLLKTMASEKGKHGGELRSMVLDNKIHRKMDSFKIYIIILMKKIKFQKIRPRFFLGLQYGTSKHCKT